MAEELSFHIEAAVEYDRAVAHSTRSFTVEDGQALSFPDGSFDMALCNLGLMLFPDPVRGLSEFRRVLRPLGCVAVSINPVVERSYNHPRLHQLLVEADFTVVDTHTAKHTFVLPSFGAYYGPFKRAGASTCHALAALLDDIRTTVREEARRYFGDTGGVIKSDAEHLIASGVRR
jgi:ubiquinone/menaquinone biosynthesis C-methylase UbiE